MIRGKVLAVYKDALILSKGYHVYQYICEQNGHQTIRKFATIRGWKEHLFSLNGAIRRLSRLEITGFFEVLAGPRHIIAKKGIYKLTDEGLLREPVRYRGSKPLNFCISPNGHMFFGEYFQNVGKESVHVYGSLDGGDTWKRLYTFEKENINHIHGLFFDKYTNRIWVATGDRENECIIGYTENEFKTFVEVFRGGQKYRTCQLFFYKDFIIYSTDTQYQQNVIKKFDRQTLEITELQKVQGSVIKGGQVGNVAFISTTVEPSDVNTDKWAHLWVTKDGIHWEEKYKAKKDWLPSIFQFGTFEFPQYYGIEKLERLYFSGRALKGHDCKTTYIEI